MALPGVATIPFPIGFFRGGTSGGGGGTITSPHTFVFSSGGDVNGVFYFAGQNFNDSNSWTNPETAGHIDIQTDPTGPSLLNGTFDEIVDRMPSDVYTNNSAPGAGYIFDLGVGRTLALTDWTYRSRSGVTTSTPTDMSIEGSNDGTTWTPIGTATLSVSSTDEWFQFSDTSSAFRYFKINQTAPNSSGGDHFTIGEFELYGTLTF